MTYGVHKTTPPLKEMPTDVVGISDGGTGANNVIDACENLNIISRHFIGENGRAISLTANKTILPEHLFETAAEVNAPTILGPTKAFLNQKTIYWITNYSDFTDYIVTADTGTVSRVGNKIFYDVPNSGTEAGFTIKSILNGTTITVNVPVEIKPFIINAPVFVFPANNSIDQDPALSIIVEPMTRAAGYFDYHESTTWVISTVSNFISYVDEVIDSKEFLTRWPLVDFDMNTDYYVRCRFKSSRYGYSDWSETLHFKTAASIKGKTPFITYPEPFADGIPYSLTVTASVFSSLNKLATHTATSWQFSTSFDFSTIYNQSLNDAGNLLSYPITGLTNSTQYWVRTKYHDSTGQETEWSEPVAFTTIAVNGILRPNITSPVQNETVPLTFTVNLSAFTVASGGDTHASTDWVLYDQADPGVVLQSFVDDAVNLTSREFTVPGYKKTYRVKARYKGTSGFISAYTVPVDVKTYRINKPEITNLRINHGSVNKSYSFDAPWMTVSGGEDHIDMLKVRVYTNRNDPTGSMVEFRDMYISDSYPDPNYLWEDVDGPQGDLSFSPGGILHFIDFTVPNYDTDYYLSILFVGEIYGDSGWSDHTLINVQSPVGPPEPVDNTPLIWFPWRNPGPNDPVNGVPAYANKRYSEYFLPGVLTDSFSDTLNNFICTGQYFVPAVPNDVLDNVEFQTCSHPSFDANVYNIYISPSVFNVIAVMSNGLSIAGNFDNTGEIGQSGYIRFRYHGSLSGWTDYSDIRPITIINKNPNFYYDHGNGQLVIVNP